MSVSEFDAWKKEQEKQGPQNQQGPKVGEYSFLQEAPKALGRGLANLVGGAADFLDMNSQVSGLHGPASSPKVNVSQKELNAPGVLNDIGNYAAQKQKDWKKTTTTGKNVGDILDGDLSYLTSGEIIGDTLESAPTMLPGVAIGALGGPSATPLAVALATGGSQAGVEAGNTYRELRAKGYDPERAKQAAMGDFWTKALLYTGGDLATAGAVRLGGSKTLGKLVGSENGIGSNLLKRAEDFAANHQTLDKYGRPLASWAGGVASEMNETATEQKLGDVWENYAKTGELSAGDIVRAFNPAYQTKESLQGAYQTIGPAGVLVGGGMAYRRRRGDKANTTPATQEQAAETQTQEQEQPTIPESAEERETLATELRADNAQKEQRIQELSKEFTSDTDVNNLTDEQFDRFTELQELRQQVADNNTRLDGLRKAGVDTGETVSETVSETSNLTDEEIDSRLADVNNRLRTASNSADIAQLNKERRSLQQQKAQNKANADIDVLDATGLKTTDKKLAAERKGIVNQIDSELNRMEKLHEQGKASDKVMAEHKKKMDALWKRQDQIDDMRGRISERLTALSQENSTPAPEQPVNTQPEQSSELDRATQELTELQTEQDRLQQTIQDKQQALRNARARANDNSLNAFERQAAEIEAANLVQELDGAIAQTVEHTKKLRGAQQKVANLQSNTITLEDHEQPASSVREEIPTSKSDLENKIRQLYVDRKTLFDNLHEVEAEIEHIESVQKQLETMDTTNLDDVELSQRLEYWQGLEQNKQQQEALAQQFRQLIKENEREIARYAEQLDDTVTNSDVNNRTVGEIDRLLAENESVNNNLNRATQIGERSQGLGELVKNQTTQTNANSEAVVGNKTGQNNSTDLTQHDHFIYRAIKKFFDDSSVMTMFKSPKQYFNSNPTLPNWDTLNISQKQRASDDYIAARNNEVVVSPKTANMEELQSLADKGYLKIVRGIKRNGEQCQLVKLLKTENGENIGKSEVVAQETPPTTRQSRAKGTREEQKARREARRNKPRKTYEEVATQPVVEENPAPEQVVAEEEKPAQNPSEDIRVENIFRDGDDYVDLSKLSDEELEALWDKKRKELMESIDNAFKYKEEHKNDADFKKKFRELLRANNRKMQDQGPILDEMNRREEAKSGSNAQSEKRNIGEKLKEKLDEANREFEETISEAKEDKKENVSEAKENIADKQENVSRETPLENKQGNNKTLQGEKERIEKARSENLAAQRENSTKQKTATGEELQKLRQERKRLNDEFKRLNDEYNGVLKDIEKEGKQNVQNNETGNQNESTEPKENQNAKTETESKNGENQEVLDEGEAGVMRRYKTVQGYWNNHHDTKWSTLSKEEQAKAKAQFDAAKAQGKTSSTNEATTDRGVEKVVSEAKKAFVGCKFERDGNALLVTLPNGMQFFIDVKRKIVLSSNQNAEARAAHNISGDMKVEGNWTKLDTKGIVGFMELATNGREGTAYHEALHAAMDLVLTENERKALVDHFKKVAKQKGIDIEEAIADGYKDWVLAKQQGKGAPFGRLFQKMKDFADKLGKVLMGDKDFRKAAKEISTEVKEEIAKYKSREIFSEIENGEVWKRGGNLVDANGDTKYLVTNPDVDESTKAYVVDITEFEKANLDDKKEIADAMQKAMKEREFKLGDSGAVVVLPEQGRKAREHYVRSFNDEQVGDSTRLKAVTAIENLLNNAVYIDKHDDHAHFKNRKYIEAYVPVRNGEHVYSMRITLRDAANTGTYKIAKAELYNIEKKTAIPSSEVIKGGAGEYVTVASMLKGVKDTYATKGEDSKPVNQSQDYLKNGKPVYSQEAKEARAKAAEEAKARKEAAEKARQEAQEKAKAEEKTKREARVDKLRRKFEFTKQQAKGKKGKQSAVRDDTPEGRAAQQVHTGRSDLPNREKLESMFNSFYEGWVDKLDPLNRLQKKIEAAAGKTLTFDKNVYKNARLANSNAATRSRMLILGMDKADSQQVIDAINKSLKNVKLKYAVTLNDVLNKLDSNILDKAYPDYLDKGAFENWQHAFSTYLVARRQMEIQLEEPGYRGPISARDAVAVVRNAPAEFKEAAKLYSQFNDNLLTILEDAGLIDAKAHDALSKAGKNYTPMMRDFTDENGKDTLDDLFAAVGGKGVGNVKSGLKELSKWGSERAVLDPLQTTVMNTYAVLSRAERNKVGQIFADLEALDSEHDFIKEVGRGDDAKADPNHSIFVVMRDGQKVAYQVKPEFYDSIVSVNEAGGELIAGLARSMAQALRVGSTISPDFMLANMGKDTIFASVVSENGFKPIWDTIRGAYKLKTDAEFAAEFESAGVPMTGLVGSNRRGALQTLDKMAGGSKWRTRNPIKLGKALLETLMEPFENLGELAESGTRAGEYLRAKENGKTIAEAAFAAKEITVDFGRSGKYGQKYNQVVPFFNACIQGTDRLARLFLDPKTRMSAIMNTVKYIMVPSLLLWAKNHNEEWYKDLPDDIKNSNWCFKTGDTIWRIPKPQEAGILFGSGLERALDYAVSKDKKITGEFAKYLAFDVFKPNLMPTVAGPLLEWYTGVSLFTGKPVVGKRYEGLLPEKQYNRNTTEIAKKIGNATGTSPMKVDNAIRGLFGGAGSFVAGTLDTVLGGKGYKAPAKDFADLPGVRRFTYQDGRRTQSSNDFFEMYGRAVAYHNSYMKGKTDPVYSDLVKVNKRLAGINGEIDDIYTHKTMSPEEKRQRIKEKEKLYSRVAKAAVERFKDKVK